MASSYVEPFFRSLSMFLSVESPLCTVTGKHRYSKYHGDFQHRANPCSETGILF